MPRCSHCGKVNREGSLFCQDCGHRLEAVAPKPAAAPVPSGIVCSSCGTTNPAGMNFCKMCGTSLAPKPAPVAEAPAPAAAPGKATCSACGKQTPAGFAFCQHCGQRLAGAPTPASTPAASVPKTPESRNLGIAPTMAANPTPPAGMPRSMASPQRVPTVNEEALANTMAPPSAMMAAAPAAKPAQKPFKGPDTIQEPAVAGTLVTLNRDGTDGESVRIVGDAFDIGRTEGSLRFGDDPYLAPRHARLVVQNGKIVLRPLDTVNGVYLRVSAIELAPGDQFLVGKEVLRYEPLAAEERDPPALIEHGVRIFGSAPREAWGRLRQLSVAGTTRDVWHLVRPELVLGREEGDVTFPDDEFMSRRHAAVRRQGAKARLEDLNSSNGTFVRVRADRELKQGDVLRMGDQLLRLEP
jgi:pSer/pThr/pTyr-binding forkhead associated (FHA) protein